MAAADTLKRTRVWNGGVRLAHWILAVTATLLIGSGWLLGQPIAPELYFDLRQAHQTAGYLLTLALVWRLYALFFGSGSDLWRDCLPQGAQWGLLRETFIFYMSGTRAALPTWYAHNPLWGPLYLLLFAVLAVQVTTGFVLLAQGAVLPAAALHYSGHVFIAAFSLLHVVAVFLHDWRGAGSDVSAMIGGYKVFLLRRPAMTPPAGLRGISIKVEGKSKHER